MIVVRNITDKMHEDELKELIYSYYDEIYGFKICLLCYIKKDLIAIKRKYQM